MTKKNLYRQFIILIKYLTKLFDAVGDVLDKFKWVGITATVFISLSHYKACKERDTAKNMVTTISKQNDSCVSVVHLIHQVGVKKADSILKMKPIIIEDKKK